MSLKELEEAIEKLKEDTQHPTSQYMPELQKAEQLGIEALGKILLLRRTEINGQKVEPYTRLPSEGEKSV